MFVCPSVPLSVSAPTTHKAAQGSIFASLKTVQCCTWFTYIIYYSAYYIYKNIKNIFSVNFILVSYFDIPIISFFLYLNAFGFFGGLRKIINVPQTLLSAFQILLEILCWYYVDAKLQQKGSPFPPLHSIAYILKWKDPSQRWHNPSIFRASVREAASRAHKINLIFIGKTTKVWA